MGMIKKEFHVKELFESDEEYQKFSRRQLRELKEGYNAGLPIEFIKQYCIPELQAKQIRVLLNAFWIPAEGQEHCRQNPDLTPAQLEEMRLGYEHGLTKEEVSLYTKNRTAREMEQLRIALECRYSKKQMDILMQNFNWMQMFIIRKCYEENVPMPFITVIARTEHNWMQMWQLYRSFKDGFTFTDVQAMAEEKLTWRQMLLNRYKACGKNVRSDVPNLVSKIMND